MWEVFAYAGDSRGRARSSSTPIPTDATCSRALSHPGITNVENYLEMTARFALRAQIGPHVRFAVVGDLMWKTDHAITFADAGVDLRTTTDDLVNPGTDEVNPLHTPTDRPRRPPLPLSRQLRVALGVSGPVLF